MEFQTIVNLLDTTSDEKDVPRFVTKKWNAVYDQSGGVNYNVNKEIRTETSVLRSVSLMMSILLRMEILLLQNQIKQEETTVLYLKIMHHLSTTFQKSMVY